MKFEKLLQAISIFLVPIFILGIILKNILVIPALVSFFNLLLIIYFLRSKYLKHIIFKIYFGYQFLTLIFALFFALIFYSSSEIYNLLNYYEINEFYLTKATLTILLYDIITIGTIIFFGHKKIFQYRESKINKVYFFDIKNIEYLSIFIVLLVSYSMKLYLMSINYWFILSDIDIAQNSFANTATVLANLDLVILLYFSFQNNRKFLDFLILILVSIISLIFAFISFSKAKIFLICIPLLIIISKLKYAKLYCAFLFILLINVGTFFEYFSYLRINSERTILENTEQFFIQDNNRDIIIEEDPIIRRLGYQFILAKCIKYVDNHNFQYNPKIYANNISGLIPRFLWKNKPEMGVDMNSIGFNLGLLSNTDFITSVGLRPIGEAYYFLKYIGILFVPIFLGLLLYLISQYFSDKYWIGFLISTLFIIEISLSDWFNLLLPSLIKIFIFNYFIAVIMNKNFDGKQQKINIKLK
jgi:hypothetical protein